MPYQALLEHWTDCYKRAGSETELLGVFEEEEVAWLEGAGVHIQRLFDEDGLEMATDCWDEVVAGAKLLQETGSHKEYQAAVEKHLGKPEFTMKAGGARLQVKEVEVEQADLAGAKAKLRDTLERLEREATEYREEQEKKRPRTS